MRVIVLGEDTPGALMHSYLRGFRANGVEAEGYCVKSAYEEAFPTARTRVGRRLFHPITSRRFNRRVVSDLAGRGADLVFVIKGQHVSAGTVEQLRDAIGCPVVNLYPDDPFADHFSARMTYGTETLAAYDLCFTFARHLIASYERVGARADYLPFAADPELHSPPPTRPEPEFDVVFVGNLDSPERIARLEAISDFRLAVFGENTRGEVPRGSPLAGASFFPPVYGADLATALARGAISINILRHQNRHSHNQRSYESPACGAFTLSEWSRELEDLFTDGEDAAFFRTDDELRAAVRRWVDDPEGRERVAAAGLAVARRETYSKRAATVLESVGLAAGTPGAS